MKDQRMEALERGNARRSTQAATRRYLRSLPSPDSRLAGAAIFRNPDAEAKHMKARYLLESITRFGPVRIGRLIRRTGLAAGRLDRKLGDLSERERLSIADHLEDPSLTTAPTLPTFTPAELTLIRQMSEAFAERTFHAEQATRLERIAQKCEAA